jgi:hypothetical protein
VFIPSISLSLSLSKLRRQFYFETKASVRQRELLEQFDFVCQCEACLQPELYSIEYEEDSSPVQGHLIMKEFIVNCKFINDNIKNYPSYELINAMHKNRRILQHLGGSENELHP